MFSCHKLWFLLAVVILLENHQSCANTLTKAAVESTLEANKSTSSQLELITDDIIHDEIEKDTKKVIRVSPLDLPSHKEDSNVQNIDSALYKIQSLKPYNGKRKYINMQRSKSLPNEAKSRSSLTEGPILRGLSLLPAAGKTLKPKHRSQKKNLHFLYNQEDFTGNLLSKSMPVHVSPGAYPVYYVVAKTNGRFGKYPLKSFGSPQAFMKYLQKNKFENLPILHTNEEEV